MIRYAKGDILEAHTEALVNTVNSVGVMGRGIALQFKRAFPGNFRAYEAACKRGEVEPGRMFVYETGELSPRFIINFPTKVHWRGKSRLEYIESGLDALVEEIRQRNIRSIAIPPLGSGLGGLDCAEVRPLIDRAMSAITDLDVVVYEPARTPAISRAKKGSERPQMTAGRAALVALMDRYLAGLLDPAINLLEVHKLMYFLQAAGEPLRLRYKKAWYGPYAENLRHVLIDVEGQLITGYDGEGDSPDTVLDLLPGAADAAEAFLADNVPTHERLARVGELVEGYETPYGLELLATVHWIVSSDAVHDPDQVLMRPGRGAIASGSSRAIRSTLPSIAWRRSDGSRRQLPRRSSASGDPVGSLSIQLLWARSPGSHQGRTAMRNPATADNTRGSETRTAKPKPA